MCFFMLCSRTCTSKSSEKQIYIILSLTVQVFLVIVSFSLFLYDVSATGEVFLSLLYASSVIIPMLILDFNLPFLKKVNISTWLENVIQFCFGIGLVSTLHDHFAFFCS